MEETIFKDSRSSLILRSVFVSIASVVLFLAILTLSITAVITTSVTTTAVHSSWTTTHSIKWLHRVSKSTKIIPMIISETIMISTSMIVAIMVLTSTKSIITTIGHIPWAWSWESWNSHHSRSHCKTKSTTQSHLLLHLSFKFFLF